MLPAGATASKQLIATSAPLMQIDPRTFHEPRSAFLCCGVANLLPSNNTLPAPVPQEMLLCTKDSCYNTTAALLRSPFIQQRSARLP
jgi:hypothetical protein